MSNFIEVYAKTPTIAVLSKLLIEDLECDFALITWYISQNYWHIAAIYDKKIDDCVNDNQRVGWYVLEEPNKKNIPIRHTILRNVVEIKSSTSKIILAFKEPTPVLPDKEFIILAFLEKIALTDLLNRQRIRQELMLSNISHSIRTPLNGILHMTNMISTADLKDDIKEAVQYLNQSSISLANNIFDIIDINKLELGKLQINKELFDIRKLLNTIIIFSNTLNKSADVSIDHYVDPSVPEYIYSDAKRIKQILINLLENAIRHTHKGEICIYVASVVVDLAAEYSTDIHEHKNTYQHYITFTISCSGLGINEPQNSLFSPPELSSNSKQNGLSLRLSYLLAKQLNGNLKIVSNLHGSCFEFSITVDDFGETSNDPAVELSSIRILVVEDEHINRIVIEKLLRQAGVIAITMAANGREALEMYKPNAFDVILIDIRMPYMSGFELADKLHAINPNVKMIGVTAQVVSEEDNKPWFNQFVYKPIDTKELIKKIKAL